MAKKPQQPMTVDKLIDGLHIAQEAYEVAVQLKDEELQELSRLVCKKMLERIRAARAAEVSRITK